MKNHYLVVLVVLFVLFLPSAAQDTRECSASTPCNLTQPVLTIDEIAARCINETFTLSGTTNLPAGTKLRVTVLRGSFSPGIPPRENPWYDGLEKETRVENDPLRGTVWTYILNTTGSWPDEYLVIVEPYASVPVSAEKIFRLDPSCSENGPGSITINPVGDHAAGEVFTITGTTNILSGHGLLIEVSPSGMTRSIRGSISAGSAGRVTVTESPGGNAVWSYRIDEPDFHPGTYRVVVSSFQSDAMAEAFFTVHEVPRSAAGDSSCVPRLFQRNGSLLWKNIPRSGADTVSGSGRKTVTRNVTDGNPFSGPAGTPLWKSVEARGGCIRCPPILNYAFLILGIVNLLAFAFFYWLLKKYHSI